MEEINQMLQEGSDVHKACTIFAQPLEQLSQEVLSACQNGNKVLLAGNGGSCAEAMHISAEFTGRYKLERKGYPAISLSTDMSAVTAIGNDYGYDDVFRRQVEAFGNNGDFLFVLSTSGNSSNLINAVEQAKQQGVKTVSLLGKDGGKLKGMCDYEFIVPSSNGPRIQEAHLTLLHIMCEIVERGLDK